MDALFLQTLIDRFDRPDVDALVLAGLQLYIETANLLAMVLRPKDEPLIKQTIELIQEGMKKS